jgi:coenzyme F420-reducing hydrogenase delta subunit/NAD-dependent dihydropyrimidine dehydrogenase PreA subunit
LVNIREGCAWPHRAEPEAATARAWDQIRMEVAHTAVLNPHLPVQAEIAPAVLVIGAGVAGMTATLELADAGFPVTLVERAATPGGEAAALAPELAADLAGAVRIHPNIALELGSHITQVNGSVGVYYATTTQHADKGTPPTRNTQHGPFGAIVVATGAPDQETSELARLLRLPQDAKGFLPEWRVRLRPDDYIERGIYVCGSAHYPCDVAEAQFQAYSAASRALRHLRRGTVTAHGAVARVASDKCNGCGDCLTVCPFAAVTMAERPGGLSLSVIDPLLCTGCGNCISVCPVGAVTVSSWTDAQLEAQMRVALGDDQEHGSVGCILIFACEWSGYAAAELAGAQKLTYPSNVRMIRLDCSGRLQPGLILKAFRMGAAGVLMLGCAPQLCHYERGNERAARAYEQMTALTNLLGIAPTRLQLAWTPPDDGPAFAELVTEFVKGMEEDVRGMQQLTRQTGDGHD